MKRIFPLSTNDANNATQSAVKSFLVASGCSQVSRLKNVRKWRFYYEGKLYLFIYFFGQLRTLRPGTKRQFYNKIGENLEIMSHTLNTYFFTFSNASAIFPRVF